VVLFPAYTAKAAVHCRDEDAGLKCGRQWTKGWDDGSRILHMVSATASAVVGSCSWTRRTSSVARLVPELHFNVIANGRVRFGRGGTYHE
jgi:hypothetical protein